ncbi:hypothetical protein BGW38_008881 [Lunasporangiospora selenospora]|uniref:EF-hand domain-containing protein n=1 Tax=Lunasporangiospora selenospora TaxID=979761 RepID=A0A9P6KGB9_9FUNG|nr:hypothetical protein BGW38_008881 [Lunasporangiospora selenospora]
MNHQEVFDRYDKDNNGTVSISELYAMANDLGQASSKTDIEYVISQFDTNNDGVLDFKEFSELITLLKNSNQNV